MGNALGQGGPHRILWSPASVQDKITNFQSYDSGLFLGQVRVETAAFCKVKHIRSHAENLTLSLLQKAKKGLRCSLMLADAPSGSFQKQKKNIKVMHRPVCHEPNGIWSMHPCGLSTCWQHLKTLACFPGLV